MGETQSIKSCADEAYSPGRIAAAKFSHEFANELSVVDAAVQLMEQELAARIPAHDSDIKAALHHVKSAILRLELLLSEFRGHGRAQNLLLQPTDVIGLIHEVLLSEKPRYTERGIKIKTKLSPKVPLVCLDPTRLRQALLNLCRNAADAMPDGGTLTLRAYRSRTHLHIAVIDTGQGIAPGLNVFALFSTTKPTGSGIGLPIVRQILSSHGGTIKYVSSLGRGTIFRLTLPVNQRTANPRTIDNGELTR
jgi:signal transduction histidine kinase